MLFKKKQQAPVPLNPSTEQKAPQGPQQIPQAQQEQRSSFFEQPPIPDFPTMTDKAKLDVRYPLIGSFAYAHISFDPSSGELVYAVEEPQLSAQEKNILEIVEAGMEEIINISFLNLTSQEAVLSYLQKNISMLLQECSINVSQETFQRLVYYIHRDFVGLNEIEPLMKDYFIEDIECNGANTPIYIVHRKYRNLRTTITFTKPERLTSFVEKLAQKCGKYVSYASPLLDGHLPDNSRVNAVYTQEIASRGASFTIRKFTTEPFSPIKLLQTRTVSPEVLAFLWLLIEYQANFMVIGSTGTGKTSFLNSIAFFIPPSARIVSIEDTKELQLLHENWLPSIARQPTGVGEEGKFGEVDLFTLLKESFRQRPDYVVVGEIRGQEAYVLFQGAASGHPCASTMHAEDVETMIRRLESPPISLPPSLVEILDVVCIMTRTKVKGEEVRRLTKVVEIIEVGRPAGTVSLNSPFVWDPASDTFYFKQDSKMFQKIMRNFGLSRDKLQIEFIRRTKLLMEMLHRNITSFKDVQDVINSYYKNAEETLKRFGIT